MTENSAHPPTLVRTDRGLSIAGTRITLYAIMDYVLAGWSRDDIRDIYRLTDSQIDDVLQYIADHGPEFEAEYRYVVQKAEENRRYWEERNRERFAEIAAMPPGTDYPEARAKLAAAKARRQQA